MNRILTYIILTSLTLLTACTAGEDDSPSADVQVKLSIRARADGGDLSNELIKDWWIVLADTEGKVVKILDRTQNGGTGAVSREEIKAEIPAGSYRAYAFANISKEELKASTGLEFAVDTPLPAGLNSAIHSGFEASYGAGTDVPMSGYTTITVKGTANLDYSIEVVRMWAKMEFVFTSRSSDVIDVEKVKLTPVYKGGIPLLPDYRNLGKAPAARPLGDALPTLVQPLGAASVPSASSGDVLSAHFYITEGRADVSFHPSALYSLSFIISRNGATEEVACVVPGLEWINRNDHIRIPIEFTNYLLQLDATFYPPIGGYPDVAVESHSDQYYAIFGSGGKYALNVRIREALAGSPWLFGSEYVLNIEDISGDKAILASSPVLDPGTSEISGELTSSVGTVCLKLSIGVPQPDGTTLTYYRNFYIVRK